MKTLIALIFLAIVTVASPTVAASPPCSPATSVRPGASEPRPLLVLIEADPWLMVVGSDSPTVAVYDTGLVIYRHDRTYRFACLGAEELSVLVGSVELAGLEPHYMAARMTDQPTSTIFRVAPDGSKQRVSVYGDLSGAAVRATVPAKLVAAYDRLISVDPTDARPWLPAEVEVMIWPYEYAPDASIRWPSKWPGLDAETTWQRGDGYSLYVPSTDLGELRAFLASRSERGAVEVGGKKWAASIRYPFPAEDQWMHAGD